MKAIKSIILFLLFASLASSAQEAASLNIGDRLPNIEIKNLVKPAQFPISTQRLNQKKLLLINFWATWCVPCVNELMLLAKIQEANREQMEVLCVGYESKSVVEAFLTKHSELHHSGLKFTYEDQLFGKLFFHKALPHNVWVDQSATIKAITGGDEVNEKNITAFIANSDNQMRVKKEIAFSTSKPLQIPDSAIRFRSIFHHRLEGVELSGSSISNTRIGIPNGKRFFVYNLRMLTILWNAMEMPGGVDRDYLYEVHTRDSSRFFWPGEGKPSEQYSGISRKNWELNNTYTYEFRVSKALDDSTFLDHVRHDLQLNLGVKVTREPRKRNCIVVSGGPSISDNKPVDAPYRRSASIQGTKLLLSEVQLEFLLEWITMTTYASKKVSRVEPYVNRTSINFPISAVVELGPDKGLYKSQEHLEKCLSEQLKFSFKRAETDYPVMVIRDK